MDCTRGRRHVTTGSRRKSTRADVPTTERLEAGERRLLDSLAFLVGQCAGISQRTVSWSASLISNEYRGSAPAAGTTTSIGGSGRAGVAEQPDGDLTAGDVLLDEHRLSVALETRPAPGAQLSSSSTTEALVIPFDEPSCTGLTTAGKPNPCGTGSSPETTRHAARCTRHRRRRRASSRATCRA